MVNMKQKEISKYRGKLKWEGDLEAMRTDNIETIDSAEAKEKLDYLIDQVNRTDVPVIITGKQTNAVLVSEEVWKMLQSLLKLQ